MKTFWAKVIGDGATDNTAIIQAAVDEANEWRRLTGEDTSIWISETELPARSSGTIRLGGKVSLGGMST